LVEEGGSNLFFGHSLRVFVANITLMTLIGRTAYPKFKQFPDAKELAELYTPTPEEIKFAKSKTKSHEGFLSFMVTNSLDS